MGSGVLRIALVSVMSAAIWVAPMAPVQAATCSVGDPCGFVIATPMGGASANSNPGGRAEASGTLNFSTARNVQISPTRVADVCNSEGTGDGLGAYLFVQADFGADGLGWLQRFPTPFKDVDGCSNGSYYDGPALIYSIERGRMLRVRVKVLECDDTPSETVCYDQTWSAWKDNPHT